MNDSIPVITLDGLSGCGKGTYSLMLAKHLGWHYLDSGALYRAVAWAVLEHDIDASDEKSLAHLFGHVTFKMESQPQVDLFSVSCDGVDITQLIRSESVSAASSKFAKNQSVRDYVLKLTRSQMQTPGLIADGRDMGTVVFPNAGLKFYLEAPPKVRAERRYLQLKEQGRSVSLRDVLRELTLRDQRDQARSLSPAKPAADCVLVSTADKTIDDVFNELLAHVGNLLSGVAR